MKDSIFAMLMATAGLVWLASDAKVVGIALLVMILSLPNVIVVAHLINAEDEYTSGYDHGLKDGINSERGDPVG
jgi:hypothetical protein